MRWTPRTLAGFLLSILLLGLCGCGQGGSLSGTFVLQEGDILFQSLPHNSLVDTIEGSTHSPFSHCGILHRKANGWVVIEAIGPVKETPLTRWTAQGRSRRYSVYRLRENYRSRIPAMISAAQSYEGRPYDMRYELDDEKIYCSELIYKAFQQASGEQLGKLQR
ncbi:MAG: YiiX/YebB-like N1pC/P60 family cysteine hydrolase, partial [Opitutaceae bacterium]